MLVFMKVSYYKTNPFFKLYVSIYQGFILRKLETVVRAVDKARRPGRIQLEQEQLGSDVSSMWLTSSTGGLPTVELHMEAEDLASPRSSTS